MAAPHRRRLCAFLGTCVLSVVSTVGVLADTPEPDAGACLACHGDQTLAVGERSLWVDPGEFNASAHAPLSCTACHTDANVLPHAETLQPVRVEPVCRGCHADAVDAYRSSPHARARAGGSAPAAACHDCHGDIHRVRPHLDAASTAQWSRLPALCARCHANVALSARRNIPVVHPVEAYLTSVHARAVAIGVRGAVCSDCHGSHEILPASDPRSLIARPNVPATCGKCHSEILASYRDSVHGEALARGHSGVPVCTDCHGEHRILAASEPTSPVFPANVPAETCGRCHGDQRLSEKYGLGVGNVASFRDSFHGLALRTGQVTVANCASCHGAHDIRPSSDPRSHVNAANLPTTCGRCHPGAGKLFAIGSVHGAASSTGAWAVTWIRFLYLALIGLTVGFMALHNLLDLSRKARRPYLPPPVAASETPERFPRSLRWQHGLLMISFPVLVYSGFALTYPETWWAAPLLRWERMLAFRGAVHRAAAILLLVALAWHLAHLAARARVRACLLGLLPAWRDVTALAHHFRLRAQPPEAAVFGYAEKLEYWAFMWGSAIMAVTGLLLWFETATLRYLPGWTADVATAIHFYEAVLATLSILVWHLYFVIFDPAVYPMDWSWWDGKPPASRAREREIAPGAEPDR